MYQSNIFSSGCIDKYFDIWPIFNIYFKNLTPKALIISIADDLFCNNFLQYGYKKIDENQMKLIEK